MYVLCVPIATSYRNYWTILTDKNGWGDGCALTFDLCESFYYADTILGVTKMSYIHNTPHNYPKYKIGAK